MIKYALILFTTAAVASQSPSLPTIKEEKVAEEQRNPKAYWRYDAYNLPPPLPERIHKPRAKRIVPAKSKSPVIPFPVMAINFEVLK